MRTRVILKTHDRSKNYLVFEKYQGGFYVFYLESQFDYLRIIGPISDIKAIDPPGGPMLCVNDNKIIPGFVLKQIIIEKDKNPKLLFKSIKNVTRCT